MTITYCRDDPVSARWSGVGRLLTEFEVDYNFYQHETRITSIESSITTTISIESISQPTPSTLLVTLTDSTTQGPFDIPAATFRDRGAWAPSTAYLVNDTFTANGALYRVIFDHTSGLTFSPTANDGAGHDYYATMLSAPGNALPTGGSAGQVLQKSSGTDYAVTWGNKLPTGGVAGQVLLKQSSTSQDAAWTTLSAINVAFAPSTGSGLASTDVAAALEELEVAISGGSLAGLSDVLFATGDPQTGALLFYGGSKWEPTASPSNTGDIPRWNSGTLVVEFSTPATAAQYLSNASDKILTTDKVWSAAAVVSLTDAATVAVDMATFINATVTLAGNRTLGNPSNTKAGQTGVIKIVQDATGSRTLAYASNWKFAGGTAPTLTTTANAVDLLYYQVISSTFIFANMIENVK